MELIDNVILCINLIDEANKKNILIDGQGIDEYSKSEMLKIRNSTTSHDYKINIRDDISQQIYKKAEEIREKYVKEDKSKINRDRVIDNYITSKIFGIPLMLLTLSVVF